MQETEPLEAAAAAWNFTGEEWHALTDSERAFYRAKITAAPNMKASID